MSLACAETCVGERVIRARRDPAMFDPRVLRNLLELEERYHVSTTYFDYVQKDVQPYMRKMVATWMMQVPKQCFTAITGLLKAKFARNFIKFLYCSIWWYLECCEIYV